MSSPVCLYPDYSSESGRPEEPIENSKLNILENNVMEKQPDGTTTSECDQKPSIVPEMSSTNSRVSVNGKVMPLVYIQKRNMQFSNKQLSKGKFFLQQVSANSVNIVSKPITTTNTISLKNKQPVLIGKGGKHLVLPKKQITIVPKVGKVTRPFVTMLKPFPKTEVQSPIQPKNASTQRSVESFTQAITVPKNSIPFQTLTRTQPPKFLLARPLSKLLPMPKIPSNNPPFTATTNTLQAGKFTVLPVPITPKKSTKIIDPQILKKLKIADGKLNPKIHSSTVTILNDNFRRSEPKFIPKLIESEADNTVTPENENNKSYELSITEEELFSNDINVGSQDSNSSGENSPVNQLPSKFSQGVSILKKKPTSNVLQDNNKSLDINNLTRCDGENDTTILKPSSNEEKIVATISASTTSEKPGNEKTSRRKSQVNVRKDFNMEMNFLKDFQPEVKEEPMPAESKVVETSKEQVNDEKPPAINIKSKDLEATHSEEPPTILGPEAYLGLDHAKLAGAAECLVWEDNVGSLPGSDLKFIINEFGILEYLNEAAYQKILSKKRKKVKEKKYMEREVQCVECGCYGNRADFVHTNFCSLDCQDLEAKKQLEPSTVSSKGLKRKISRQKSDNDIKDISAEDETSNDTLKGKFVYPWECKKKGFSWSKYLLHMSAKAAPVKLFKDPFPYTRNGFKIGMKLEGVDPQHPSCFCILTIKDVVGYRICMHFDGYSSNYDFWINADSPDVFPMGWCEKNSHTLRPPPSYTENNFNWLHYLKVTKGVPAPKHLFINRGQAICPNGFRIGMKLEAVDKKDSSLICVATVKDMMDNRILVHFDGWDDIYDYWADPSSPYIHPVGWCDQYGHDLTAPSDYPTPKNFTWEKYLKETKAAAAPVRAFKQRPVCGFKRDMRLECVDKRVPHLIRVATVDDVKEHQIRIRFDGWPDRYSYWVDDDSPDIHPAGWSQKTGHPIEPPLTPEDVYDFLECPTVGCRGQGHTEGLKYTTHSSQIFCPYADENIDKVLADRLLSPDTNVEEKEPVSRQSKKKRKPKMVKNPKWQKASKQDDDVNYEPTTKKTKTKDSKKLIIKSEPKSDDEKKPSTSDETSSPPCRSQPETPPPPKDAYSFMRDLVMDPAERESWKTHSEFLREYIPTDANPSNWSIDDVHKFVTSIPDCEADISLFKKHKIDGEAFLQLKMTDFLGFLKIKVGAAVKLYNSILLIRKQDCDRKKEKP